MNITVYGAGYVGLVSALGLAELGHRVLCCDVDTQKIAFLKQGKLPICEQNLDNLLHENLFASRIEFSTDSKEAASFGLVQMITVGTPSNEDGSVDLRAVDQVVKTLAAHLSTYSVIAVKSTVPTGTVDHIKQLMATVLVERQCDIEYDVVSNHEFLKEGTAIVDFMQPNRIVVGTTSPRAADVMRELYAYFIEKNVPFLVMDERSAELTKYAANAFLATKISFMNEMSQLSEALGADIENVKKALGLDPRIGSEFINPGCGFGGSCFPKDMDALVNQMESQRLPGFIARAVLSVNEIQKKWLFEKLKDYFNDDLKGKVIALWGLAFKPNTDDVRAAPSRILLELLEQAGACVQAYDPLAMDNIRNIYGDLDYLRLGFSAETVLENADALVIVTEWKVFGEFDLSIVRKKLANPVIFDGRNMFDPRLMQEMGLEYFSIGRVAKFAEVQEVL